MLITNLGSFGFTRFPFSFFLPGEGDGEQVVSDFKGDGDGEGEVSS